MRGVVVVIFEDSPTDIDQKMMERNVAVTKATGGTDPVYGFTGQLADDIADIITLHNGPEPG